MQTTDMHQQTGEEIVARLARARAEALAAGSREPILAFDADGTLWSGDVGVDLFTAFLASGRVLPVALAALEAEAESVGLTTRGDAFGVARALYDAFEAGQYHEARAFAMMAWAFAGWTLGELDAFASKVLTEARIDERMHEELAPVLAWARANDVTVHVVSASPRAAVERGVASLGIRPEHVLAMTPGVSGGVVEPYLDGHVVYGEGKLEALRATRPSAVLLGGFGDSSYDAAFLRDAKVPVAVRPKESLSRVAHTIPGLFAIRP